MNALLLAAATLIGSYSHQHDIGMLAYDKAGCAADEGTWQGDDDNGVCVFGAEDTVEIAVDYSVKISTVATNAHTCDFAGAGKLVAPNVVIATQDACSLRVTEAADQSVNVSIESGADACRDLCGAGVGLEITAQKKK
jgi:hypothetical protein